MSQIYDSTFNYLELIKSESPPPEPKVSYSVTCELKEENVYDEPVQELLPEPEKESTPEYKPVPVKDLINSWEQGKFSVLGILYDSDSLKKIPHKFAFSTFFPINNCVVCF